MPCAAAQHQRFPKPRVSTAGLVGVWMDSPIVAVGDVANVASYGEETIDRLPPPTAPSVHQVYWCVGDFHAEALVKGTLHVASKRYLFASTFPGCRVLPDDPAALASRDKTRVWFLREEGEFLRPTFDWGTFPFLGLLAEWDTGAPLPPRERLGALLLTPLAVCDTTEAYAEDVWLVADIACELLGKAECVQRIRMLALEIPVLREPACHFLKGQLEVDCGTQR